MARFVVVVSLSAIVFFGLVGLESSWGQDQSPSIQVTQFKAHLDAAETAARAQDVAKVTEHVNAAVGVLEEILKATRKSDVPEIRAQHKRLVAAHRLLKNAKAKPEPLPQLKFNYVESDSKESDMSVKRVSFQATIAPLIAQKCGNCHVREARGNTSLASAADIAAHVFPGDSARSYLFEIVANNTMPPNNNKLTDEEKKTLKQWIDEGGQLDAGQTMFDLRPLVQPEPSANMAEVPRATESDTVFFSKDIAPLLAESCNGCHIAGNNLRGGLSVESYVRLMRGGDSGAIVVAGNPEESLLIKKLKGTADGQQMPINRPKWTAEQIELISTWIREGARFDALDPNQSVVSLAQRAAIQSMSVEQLQQRRAELLVKNWKLALVDQAYQQGQSEHFAWIAGDKVDSARIEQWIKIAEQEFRQRQEGLAVATDNAFAQGRISVFIPGSNYDYTEFAKMLSRREATGTLRGYWDQSLEGPYIVLSPSLTDEQIEENLSQWVGSAMVANIAPSLPSWFCDSVALALQEERRGRGRPATPPANPGSDSVPRWLEGRLDPATKQFLDQAAATAWKRQRQDLKKILAELQSGQPLESLLQARSGGTVTDFVKELLQ
ncbi:MAG: hypothetical protein JNL67_09730 [Planctomycetaceae bacterium]|nr:hypothetical protein [Planctomycetaceae bacterium]